MLKILLLFPLFLIFFSIKITNAVAETRTLRISDCGSYFINGKLVLGEKFPYLVVNEKSKSEMRFKVNSDSISKIVLLMNKNISLEASVTQLDGTQGVISNIKSVNEIAPNPLYNELSNGFSLIKKMECKND
jgi:hypothetical protein